MTTSPPVWQIKGRVAGRRTTAYVAASTFADASSVAQKALVAADGTRYTDQSVDVQSVSAVVMPYETDQLQVHLVS